MPNKIELSYLLYQTGKYAGVLAFVFLSFLIFSGDIARFFDRFFGLDKIIKFQRKFSIFTAVFVGLHPLFFILSGELGVKNLLPDFTKLPSALGVLSLYTFTAVLIASQLYKRISYLAWQYIHVVTYLLFFMALTHAFLRGSNSGMPLFKVIYGTALTAVIIGIIYRTTYKIRKRYAGKFHVKSIKWETHDTFTLTLEPEKPFTFKAGQFCFLSLQKNRLFARHPFTMSSPPSEKLLNFTMKKAGRFIDTASDLKPGEEVWVDGPFGKFTQKKTDKTLVFIAGGVGITPFMSLLSEFKGQKNPPKTLLLYACKTAKDIIFRKAIDVIKCDWFRRIYLLSQEQAPDPSCETGHVNAEVLQKYVGNIKNSLFYICGPEAMKREVKKVLADLGVEKKNILVEDFFW